MEIEPQIRYTVRILLVDESDRILLYKGQDPANLSDVFWCPIGGGIEAGESPEEAARREVKEETGLIDFKLGPHVWNREDKYTFNGIFRHTKEVWFFARVSEFEVDTSELLTPRKLAPLMKDLIAYGIPKFPLDLGFD